MPSINLKNVDDILTKGLTAEFAPDIVKGVLLELFSSKNVNLKEAMCWVEQDISLWSKIPPEYQPKLRGLVKRIGVISWFDANWAINSLRAEKPALASLFLGWKKAYNWLSRQCEDIKRELQT